MGYPGDQQSYSQPQFPQGTLPPAGRRRDASSYDPASSYGPASARGPASAHGASAHRASAYEPEERGAAAGPDRGSPEPPAPAELDWDPDAKGPLWRRPLILGAAGLALIAALFLGLWVAARNDRPVPQVAEPSPTPIISAGPEGKFGYAGSRATDKTPLTVKELFGKKKITQDGRSYALTVWRNEKKCADGISGAALEKALRRGGCNQLIRASYKDGTGTIIGTVGVANMKTSATAKKAASAGGGGERKDFLKPLPGKDDITKFLGSGDAYAGGWTHGHYAVLLWFQFKDGHHPSKNELKRLYRAAVDITDQTVFPALETRSLTGGRG